MCSVPWSKICAIPHFSDKQTKNIISLRITRLNWSSSNSSFGCREDLYSKRKGQKRFALRNKLIISAQTSIYLRFLRYPSEMLSFRYSYKSHKQSRPDLIKPLHWDGKLNCSSSFLTSHFNPWPRDFTMSTTANKIEGGLTSSPSWNDFSTEILNFKENANWIWGKKRIVPLREDHKIKKIPLRKTKTVIMDTSTELFEKTKGRC